MERAEPWQLEEGDALEIEVGSVRVAWTDDDAVFILSKGTRAQPTREDGFIHIGQLEWVGDVEDEDEEGVNIKRLREFVLKWQREKVES